MSKPRNKPKQKTPSGVPFGVKMKKFTVSQQKFINKVKAQIKTKFHIAPDFEQEMDFHAEFIAEHAKPDENAFELTLGYWKNILGNESM